MGILKNKDLPKWLDKIIYTDFGAIFEPHPQDVVYNPDQPYEFVKIYLGTYFPRSYAEAFCITRVRDKRGLKRRDSDADKMSGDHGRGRLIRF